MDVQEIMMPNPTCCTPDTNLERVAKLFHRRASRVIARSIQAATIETEGDVLYHVDGEIGRAKDRVKVTIRPGILKVRVAIDTP